MTTPTKPPQRPAPASALATTNTPAPELTQQEIRLLTIFRKSRAIPRQMVIDLLELNVKESRQAAPHLRLIVGGKA